MLPMDAANVVEVWASRRQAARQIALYRAGVEADG